MPTISRFLGILIFIHFNEHNPPHFHAEYGSYSASLSISDLKLMGGKLPPRVLSLVLEWAFLHREELLENWDLAQKNLPLKKIKGLV
jgi:hypothetical protein